MEKFKQITMIDACRLTQESLPEIQKLSENPLRLYWDYPKTESEVIERIGGSDCVLVSFQTRLTPSIIKASPNLKYIGMCCSLFSEESSNVDIPASRERGITVKGVFDYGDEGVVEYIFNKLISLAKGLEKYQWKDEPCELSNKSIGLIGMGTTATMVAAAARIFGMKVYYYSRTRKSEEESKGATFLPLKELMATCDVISIHLPRHTLLLHEEEFAVKKKNSILINTSLGALFNKQAFYDWLNNDPTSYAIFDRDGCGDLYEELSTRDRVITYDRSAGFTFESKQRLSQKALDNMKKFLREQKTPNTNNVNDIMD